MIKIYKKKESGFIKNEWLKKSGTNKIFINLTYSYDNGFEPQEIIEFDVFKFPKPNYLISYLKNYIKEKKLEDIKKYSKKLDGVPSIHINIYQELNINIEFIDEIKDKLQFEDYENENSIINGKYLYNIAYFQFSLKELKSNKDLQIKQQIINLVKKNCKDCKTEEDYQNFIENIFDIECLYY